MLYRNHFILINLDIKLMDNRNLKRLAYGAGMLAGVVGAYLCYNQYMSKYKKIVNKSTILTDT